MVRCVVGSIHHSGPNELFLVPASSPRLVQQRSWYVLFCIWGGANKRTLTANCKNVVHVVPTPRFLFPVYPTPYNRKLNVLSVSLNKTYPLKKS